MTTRADTQSPPRVIHVVESFDTGAVENWLLRMLAHAVKTGAPIDWTFYCTLDHVGAKEAQAVALGAKVLRSPVRLTDKLGFARALRRTLKSGRYDTLHCHHDLVSGLYLAAAAGLPIRRRLVHVHNADEFVLTPSRMKTALLREPLRRIGLTLADRIVGISNHTLDTYLAGRPRRPGRDVVHYYGIDPTPFAGLDADRAAFRQELGLSPDALVLLFGGRIVPEKNPVFTVEVLAALAAVEPRAVAIFAGAGALENEVRARAEAVGVADRIRMIGWRHDLPEVMAASDWFILPRPETPLEGFGLAVVEAQLAGLRMLLSKGVPDDPLLPTARVRRLSLADGPEAWARAARDLLAEPPPIRAQAQVALAASPMAMDVALAGLVRLHA